MKKLIRSKKKKKKKSTEKKPEGVEEEGLTEWTVVQQKTATLVRVMREVASAPEASLQRHRFEVLKALKETTASSDRVKQEVVRQARAQREAAGENYARAWKVWEAEFSEDGAWFGTPDEDPRIQAAEREISFAETTLYLSNLAVEGGEAVESFLNWAKERGAVEEGQVEKSSSPTKWEEEYLLL